MYSQFIKTPSLACGPRLYNIREKAPPEYSLFQYQSAVNPGFEWEDGNVDPERKTAFSQQERHSNMSHQ
jgi:hypothetical protein